MPSSDDFAAEGGYIEKIDKASLIPLLCTPDSHSYVLHAANREALCSKCKHGIKFKVSQIKEIDGRVTVEGKDGRVFELAIEESV